MSKRSKGCLVAAIIGYLVLATILVAVKLLEVQDLHSPPTASRDTPGFKSGSLGLLKEASHKIEQVRPAAEEMTSPLRHEGENGSFLLEWADEKILPEGSPPDPWVNGLAGDDELELVAFATWIPQAKDPLPSENPEHFPLQFHDPTSLELISPETLDSLGVPEKLRILEPPREYHTPRLRLLFRSRNMEYMRFNGINIGDAKTKARVGYDLEYLDEQDSHSETFGEWSKIDGALLIWHDSPLTCRVEILTGEPQLATLDQKLGEQVVFGDALRLQWIGHTARETSVGTYVDNYKPAPSVAKRKARDLRKKYENQSYRDTRALLVELDDEEDSPPRTLIRASSDSYLENHTAILTPDGPDWSWDSEEEEGNLYLASTSQKKPLDQPLQLVFLPQTTELVFEIPGLPNVPNRGQIDDLFDISLPRITLPENLSDAERHLIGYISVASQVEWDSTRKWDDHPPTNLPDDYTFRNETPQSLLNWYLENTKGAFARYDEDELVLYVNEKKESWWSQLLDNWSNLLPFP